jgi:hypothetical protein
MKFLSLERKKRMKNDILNRTRLFIFLLFKRKKTNQNSFSNKRNELNFPETKQIDRISSFGKEKRKNNFLNKAGLAIFLLFSRKKTSQKSFFKQNKLIIFPSLERKKLTNEK